MPFKSKNNNARNNGSRKTESILKTIYKRYNPEKVTIKGLKNFFGMVFYKTGYDVEMVSLKIWKKISKVLLNVAADVFSVAKAVAVFFDKLTDTILDDLGEPLDRVGSAFAGISEIIKETKNDKSIKTGKLLRKYIREGLEKHKDLAKTLYSYVGPLVMAGIFCIVVGFTMFREYAIQVSLDGQDICVINNYTVLKNADKIIKNKLVSTNEQTWELDSDI